ncbi:MAG: DEAD/DEAH box helicase domain-containing protein, partial [Paraglaciecola sp.]
AYETYRFCSNCDYLEKEHAFINRNCPKCHDASWGQPTNQHLFVRQQAVTSFNDEKQSAIDDKTDERVELISRTSQHFDFSAGKTKGAWAMIEIPFGIEFVPEVTLRTVNLGVVENRKSGDEIEINEKKVNRRGFLVCKSCGRGTSSLFKEDNKNKEAIQYHFGNCPHRNVAYDGTNTDIFREIFLYRALQTEVLKILIPVYELESDADIKMFKAGLVLGLKHYFGGNPQHIQITDYQEKNERTGKSDRYLILYDTIPGGTGYLEELFVKQKTTKPFNQIIRAAYEQIKGCSCQEKGQDGCYRCIYTYKNQFNRHELSRAKAEGLFEKIYLASENWQYLDGGLNTLISDARLEESKLEELFIYQLKQRIETESNKDEFSKWHFEIIKNPQQKNIYRITTTNNHVYDILPQIDLGVAEGILYPTRPDFLIKSLDAEISKYFEPIAVYLDGHAFHASETNNIVFQDLKKRQHLSEKGYQTWTLSWDDVRGFEQKKADAFHQVKLIWMDKKGWEIRKLFEDFPIAFLDMKNNMERLFWLLDNPNKPLQTFVPQFLYGFQKKLNAKMYEISDFEAAQENGFDLTNTIITRKDGALIYLDNLPTTEFFKPFLGNITPKLGLYGGLYLKLNNGGFDKKSWEAFWHLYNLLQSVKMITFEVEEENIHQGIPMTSNESTSDVLEEFDESFHEIIIALKNANILFDGLSPFVLMDKNREIASAGLGIPEHKIAIDVFEEDKKYFEKAGYQIFNIDDFFIDLITKK